MSMSVGAVSGYGGVNPYEAYADRFSGNISAEDAAEMADAVDFDGDPDRAQELSGVQQVEQNKDNVARIEPAEESAGSTADHLRGDLSGVMEDMMDIQGSLWGFSVRRVIPLAGGTQ